MPSKYALYNDFLDGVFSIPQNLCTTFLKEGKNVIPIWLTYVAIAGVERTWWKDYIYIYIYIYYTL